MADDDIREGNPEKARKKKAPPPDDDNDDRPRKKKRADADEDDEAPRKKKKAAQQDDDGGDGDDLGSSPLSAIIPVGGSVFALASLWLSIFALALAVVALGSFFKIITVLPPIPALLACLMPSFWPLAILCGGLAFLTGKRKMSYGSISGNMRAIFGILIGLLVMVMHGVIVFLHVKG